MTKEEIINKAIELEFGVGNAKSIRDHNSSLVKVAEHLYDLMRPSLPANLDEAAEEVNKSGLIGFEGVCWLTKETPKHFFKAGAEWMAGLGVSLSHLIAWYIQSVDASEPVWTEEHLEELVKDYILIPKN